MRTIDLAVILAYFGLLSWIGYYFSKRQKSRDEYFLGGRQMHWILVGGSVMASLLSTITFLNTPGEMMRYGVAFFASLLIVPLLVPVINLLIIPLFLRLPVHSAYEYYEKRFDGRTRTFAAGMFIFRTLIHIALIIYSASFALAEISGWNIFLVILVIATVTNFYTTAGGFRTVIWTDNLQLWILLAGAVMIPVYVAFAIGSGPSAWWATFSHAGRTSIQVFSWDPTVRVTAVGSMMSYFFWNICTQGSDQVAVQRYLSTPSIEAAKRSVWVYAFFKLVLTLLLMLCGLALFAYYQNQGNLPVAAFQKQIAPQADRIMPRFIVQVLPPGLSGLLLAALFSAAMCSLSSGINSVSSVVSADFLPRFALFSGWRRSVRVDKWVAAVAGTVGMFMAMAVAVAVQSVDWNLVELTHRVNNLLVGSMGVLFFAGVLFRRVGTAAVLTGFAVGMGFAVFTAYSKELFGMQKSISFLWVVPSSFLFGMLAAYLASFIFTRPAVERIRELTVDVGSR